MLPLAWVALPLSGCDKQPAGSETASAPEVGATHDAHAGHDTHKGHDTHAGHDAHDAHPGGAVTQLGEQSVGGFTIKASRDGVLTAGGEAPVDVWITGSSAKVTVVRFWIGTQDAKGSVKAKAELEKDNWHTHVEVPKTLPTGSKLWVEIVPSAGENIVAGFELGT